VYKKTRRKIKTQTKHLIHLSPGHILFVERQNSKTKKNYD